MSELTDIGAYYDNTGAIPMRNQVKILDPSIPCVSILELQPGEMFQYYNTVGTNNCYMKLDGLATGNAAVFLPTGMYYDIDKNAKLKRISLIQLASTI